jgi:Bacteriophage tail sheath protein
MHAIIPAPTSVAIFVGYSHPLKTIAENDGKPVRISGFADYQRQFGGFVRSAAFAYAFDAAGRPGAFGDLAQAVNQFFLNGGTDAYVVSVNRASSGGILSRIVPARALDIGGIAFTQREVTDEVFLMGVVIRPSPPENPPTDPVADIVISYGPATAGVAPSAPTIATGPATVIETYRQVSLDPDSPNYIANRLAVSSLVAVSLSAPPPGSFPDNGGMPYFFPVLLPRTTTFYSASDFTAVMQNGAGLDQLTAFNLMVLPGIADNSAGGDGDTAGVAILAAAAAFCEQKKAFLIMDPPVRDSSNGSIPSNPHSIEATANDPSLPRSKNAALYFPYLLSPDPLTGSAANLVTGNPNEVAPAAAVAGIYASTDRNMGVWKSPAGVQAAVARITGVVARGRITDQRQRVLNQLGVNCLREFPGMPTIVFGARTLATMSDQQWRFVPVRRMALFLEQTLDAGLQWTVFEPNAAPLWTDISESIEALMSGLFRQGAFQGIKPSEAFFVKCDGETTTQADIDNGIVNILIGFAPLKPAEFVIIEIAQMAGQRRG